jgi:hypothetical protein
MTVPTTKFYRSFPDHPIVQFLAGNAIVLLADLYWHRNGQTSQLNPRLETLAHNRGWSYSKVRRLMASLRDCGIVRAIRGRRSSSYEIRPTEEWHRPVCRERSHVNTNSERSEMNTLNPPILIEQETLTFEQYADGVVVSGSSVVTSELPTPSAAAAAGSSENIPTQTLSSEGRAIWREAGTAQRHGEAPNGPGLLGGSSPSQAADLILELAPNHPAPGNVHRAGPVLEQILRTAEDKPATIAQIRANHQGWRLYWAALPAGRFIPQLHRWFRDNDWQFAPSPEAVAGLSRQIERKPLTKAERMEAMHKRLEAQYAENERSAA